MEVDLASIISLVSKPELSSLSPTVFGKPGFCLTRSEAHNIGFLVTRVIL